MMSVEMKKAHKLAEEYNKTIRADDPRLGHIVIVKSENDYATFVYPDAFALRHGDWNMVFTEHYGFHVYHVEDANVAMYGVREHIEDFKEKKDEKVE